MIKKLLAMTAILIAIGCYGREITFLSEANQPIADVSCVGYSAVNDSIGSWKSDGRGIVNIDNKSVRYLVSYKSGFGKKLTHIDSLSNSNFRIVLDPETNLKEVVVTPSDVEEFDTHTSYRLSQKDMARYSNVLQSLNLIPNLTVLSNGGVFFEGQQNVKILIDGVEASMQEVQTLSKEDIAKVNVYKNPPARFLVQGVASVIDIQLKSNVYGGNVALQLEQAFHPLKGENSAAVYYNYKQSRFSLLYNNENKHHRKFRRTEVLDYDFGGVNYNKVKEGLDSKEHTDNNTLNLTYQINKPGKFLYNVKAAVGFDRSGGTMNQKVTSNSDSFLASNYLHSGYTQYKVGNYFEKILGENIGVLSANINYQHYSTKYSSAYEEAREDNGGFRGSHSDYKTHLDAVFSELQYQFPDNKYGYFYIGLFEANKHSKYVDTTDPFFQSVNGMGVYGFWYRKINRVQWTASMGAAWYNVGSTLLDKSHNLVMPTPTVLFSWRPLNNLYLSLRYSYTGGIPSIAQLSETNQWLDTRLVYHGNSTLKPYKTHAIVMAVVLNSKYVDFSLTPCFSSSPDMICDMYTEADNYMLQTLVNLSSYRELSSMLDISLKPLGNDKLTFWNRIIGACVTGKNPEYSWKGHRFQWMSNLSLNFDHWGCELFYQYPGKGAQGQLIRPRAQFWSIMAQYRPSTNLSVGVKWSMPFGNGFKEKEYTVSDAPVFASDETNIMDWNNLVSIILSYNFSFGRNRNSARPRYDNGDSDSGILRK